MTKYYVKIYFENKKNYIYKKKKLIRTRAGVDFKS